MDDSLPARLRATAEALGDAPVSVADLSRAHGTGAQGTLLVLLAAPCLMPVPGIGNVMGAGLMIVGLAMWRGDAGVGLPPRVARASMPVRWAARVLRLLARLYEIAGLWSRRRLERLASPRCGAWAASNVALMGAIIFLPVPLGNVLPACSVMLLGLGLTLRDGVAVMLSWLAAAVAVVYTVMVSAGVSVWLAQLFNRIG